MSKKGSDLKSFLASARAAAVPKRAMKEPVHVGQGEAAMVPRRLAGDDRYRHITTQGLGPCVGVIVVGGENVGLAHIDSDSVGIAADLARFAVGTIPDLVKIVISSGTKLPQPGNAGDRSPTRIYEALMQQFPSALVKVLNLSDIGCDVKTGEVVEPLYVVPAARTPGIPYWNVKKIPPELVQPLEL